MHAFSLLYSKLLLAKLNIFVFGAPFAASHWEFVAALLLTSVGSNPRRSRIFTTFFKRKSQCFFCVLAILTLFQLSVGYFFFEFNPISFAKGRQFTPFI